MRIGFGLAIVLCAAAALAQVTQAGSPPGSASTGSTVTANADAGVAGTQDVVSAPDGGAGRAARTGDTATTPSGQRIYSFDPPPIGGYSFDVPSSSGTGAATSRSGPSATPP